MNFPTNTYSGHLNEAFEVIEMLLLDMLLLISCMRNYCLFLPFGFLDDDEDDTEALLAELEQIKKERAEENARKEQQQREEELKAKEAEMLRGNPLLTSPVSFGAKRRWDDDLVFKNQARGEVKTAKRFINDTIRNDFHRKFLQKYIK